MRIFQVDTFTTERFSGNPATVILDADDESEEWLAAVAREFPHAETVFVLPADAPDHDIALRFFNARKEATFVGHATLAAHRVLLALQRRGYGEMRQKTRQGSMTVTAYAARNVTASPTAGASALIEFRQPAAALDPPLALKDSLRVAQALGLPGELVHETMPALVARRGSTRLLLPVATPNALNLVTPNPETLIELGKEFDAEGFFAFAVERAEQTVTTHARMFCPALGIVEDPVSGNAHAMLAAYLWDRRDLRPVIGAFIGHQGQQMKRAGEVHVRLEVDGGELVAAHVGGHAVIVSEGRLIA